MSISSRDLELSILKPQTSWLPVNNYDIAESFKYSKNSSLELRPWLCYSYIAYIVFPFPRRRTRWQLFVVDVVPGI